MMMMMVRAIGPKSVFVAFAVVDDSNVFFIINCFLFENATNHIGNGSVAKGIDGDRLAPPTGKQAATAAAASRSRPQRAGSAYLHLPAVYLNSHSFITLMVGQR